MNGRILLTGVTIVALINGCCTKRTNESAALPEDSASTGSDGVAVFGIFRGRTPCREIGAELGWPERHECLKKKIVLTLYHDPVTRAPTLFRCRGLGDTFKEGQWRIVEGAKVDPRAVVYQLTAAGVEKPLRLLRGDDNVLFFLSSDRTLLVGNADYSYTLNRQEHPAKFPGYVAP